MRALRSVWRMQIIPVIVAPSIEILRRGGAVRFISFGTMNESRIRPYPPSFRRILARIIDPAVGASTWAFGSQR